MKPKPPKSHRDLWVWQRSVALVLDIHGITQHVPYNEPSGTLRHLCRSAVSIPSRIARGVGIGRYGSYIRCLLSAYGFTLEVETALHIAREIKLISDADAARALVTNEEIAQMLVSMVSSLEMLREPEG
ncbi:MAG: four helix bundle protein [Gemmatimonadaceae bacterium]